MWARACRACLQRFPRAALRDLTPAARAALQAAAALQIDLSEDLPNKLCGTCLQRADDAAQFKIQCQQSENKLRSYLKEKERKKAEKFTSSTPIHSDDFNRSPIDSLILDQLPFTPFSCDLKENDLMNEAENEDDQLSNFGEDSSITNFINALLEDELQINNPIEKLTSDSPAHIINPDSVLSFLKSDDLGSIHSNKNMAERSINQSFEIDTKEETFIASKTEKVLRMKSIEEINSICEEFQTSKYFNTVIETENVENDKQNNRVKELKIDLKAEDNSEQVEIQADNYAKVAHNPKLTEQYYETVDIELVKTIIPIEKIKNIKGYMKCRYCSSKYMDADELYAHLVKCHQIALRKIVNKKFTCNLCDKIFKVKHTFETHLAMHARNMRPIDQKFICDVCDKVFTFKFNLVRHLAMHEDKLCKKPNIHCSICNMTFERVNGLKLHMKIHLRRFGQDKVLIMEDKKASICPECGKTFSNNSNLKAHMKLHDTQSSHPCNICKKEYKIPRNLIRHMRTHTGERPHKCHQCEKTFARSDKLARHMRVHTREKLYRCEECFKIYQQSNGLKWHMKNHHGIGEILRKIEKNESRKKKYIKHSTVEAGVESIQN